MGATYTIERWGHKYIITVDDDVMEETYAKGELCEQVMLDWIIAKVPHGGIWVDCGANVGNHTMVFATACEADVVLAFEPVPWNHETLLANTAHLPNVIAPRLGVGAGPQLCEILPTAQNRNSQFALRESANKPNTIVVSLDAVVPWKGVRMLKVDVEGMELDVLKGARSIIMASRPEIFVEVWVRSELDNVAELLRPFGYILIERSNCAPTYHFSASGRYPVTYTEPKA